MTVRGAAWFAAMLTVLVAGCTSHGAGSDGPEQSGHQSGAGSDSSPGEVPTPTVLRRDFQISYQLDGATEAAVSVPISPPVGMVWRSHVDTGTAVSAGDRIGKWSVDPAWQAALTVGARTSRIDAARLAVLGNDPAAVTSPVSGVVQLSDTDGVSVAAPGIDVVVAITGIQQLRLSSVVIQAQATVETVVGQRTVACDYVWTGESRPSSGDTVAAASLRCRLPRIVETAPGLRATLHVTSRVIPDAVVVPDMMLGQNATGYTVTIVENGAKTTVPVDVGPSDGVVRVIISELPVGATIVPPDQ